MAFITYNHSEDLICWWQSSVNVVAMLIHAKSNMYIQSQQKTFEYSVVLFEIDNL